MNKEKQFEKAKEAADQEQDYQGGGAYRAFLELFYKNADVPLPKGPNDLEATIERLEFRNAKLHNYNEKIEQEIIELRRDNKKLSKQCEDLLHQFRNKGVL